MSEQEEKVLYYCREWYRTGREVIKQTLWYEIGVMLENEPDAEHNVHPTVCQCGEDCIPMLGEDTCVRCDLPLAHSG